MRPTLSLLALAGAILFFACGDSGSDDSPSRPPAGGSGGSQGGSSQAGSSQAGSSQTGGSGGANAGAGGSGGANAGAGGSEGGQGGAGTGGGGVAETTNELCSDGKDNDGNGFADCEDFNCATGPGITVCNSTGGNGGSSGTGGNGGSAGSSSGAENTVELCSDGKDNDGDKYIDCEDKNCCALVDCKQSAPTSYCAKQGTGGTGGGSGTPEDTVELCSDGKDNDGDKYIDCEDKNCCALVDCKQSAPTSYCAKQGTGGTGGGSGTPENSVELCSDGKDNDGDKYIDCEDKDCCALVDCKQSAPTSYCAKQGTGGTGGGSGTPENSVELCSDGKDNDGDKYIDCEDKDCCALVDCKQSAPTSYCAKQGTGGTGGSSGVKENTVELCTDKKDNDGDKYIDCNDFDCCAVVDCKTLAPTSSCAKKSTPLPS